MIDWHYRYVDIKLSDNSQLAIVKSLNYVVDFMLPLALLTDIGF